MESLNKKSFNFREGNHRDKDVIWIHFPKNEILLSHLKQFVRPKWSRTEKAWYVLDVKQHRNLFGLEPKTIGARAEGKINAINKPNFQKYIETLRLKAYSANTIQIYASEFGQFLATLKSFDANQLNAERLRSYFIYCVKTLKLKENHLHSRINAVKFYYEKVLLRDRFFIAIPRPKKPSTLPKAITQKDIAKMFATVGNIKHLLMLKLCYGMGLRVSEIINLKITDIDSTQMQVLVARAKGKKDRYVNLPQSVLNLLREYYKIYLPKEYLFEGQRGGAYSVRSLQAVFKKALRAANINKAVGIHSLRHSYATHLLQAGVDISFIKELLGHNNIKTTLIYTKLANKNISNIKSPLDNLIN